MPKVLVIGGTGQLGYDLVRLFSPEGGIGLSHKDADITDAEKLGKAIQSHSPSIIINAAALTNTNTCEEKPEQAMAVNALGAFHVARAAKECGAAVVYISTDYVFDGSKSLVNEEDFPNPLNVYGVSKFTGEALTRIANPRHYIIRTAALFGENVSHKGYNFVTLMLEKAKKGEEIKAVGDQITSPTYTVDLAAKIEELLRMNAPFGAYHLVNSGRASWYQFAQQIFTQTGINPRMTEVTTEEFPSTLSRPKNLVLEDTKLQPLGIAPLRPWQEALEKYLSTFR